MNILNKESNLILKVYIFILPLNYIMCIYD